MSTIVVCFLGFASYGRWSYWRFIVGFYYLRKLLCIYEYKALSFYDYNSMPWLSYTNFSCFCIYLKINLGKFITFWLLVLGSCSYQIIPDFWVYVREKMAVSEILINGWKSLDRVKSEGVLGFFTWFFPLLWTLTSHIFMMLQLNWGI